MHVCPPSGDGMHVARNNDTNILIRSSAITTHTISGALIQEVIEHANRANKLTKQMHDYHNDYELINNYLRDNDNTCPFVITGLSGAGKSSFMAFVAKKVKFLMITKNSKI